MLVYVGGISPEKGALVAVACLARLRDAHPEATLRFVGSVQAGRDRVRRSIDAAGLEGAVEWFEWRPYEEMLALIEGADVGLALHQPQSRFERVSTGNGRKFFSYMQAGLPIVGPAFGEVGEVVRETDCGVLVDTTDVEEVATAVESLLGDPESREHMARRGREAVATRYNWDEEKRKFLAGYDAMFAQ